MTMSRAVEKGMDAFETSVSDAAARTSRDLGPTMLITALPEVTSIRWTVPSSGMFRLIQSLSWTPKPEPVIM